MDTIEIIYKTLETSAKSMKASDISEKSGINKAEVDKALKQLVKEEKVFSPQRCFYAVKK
jgi:DNA-binding transcriptional regulator GbsR (MarR family)